MRCYFDGGSGSSGDNNLIEAGDNYGKEEYKYNGKVG